MDVTLGTLLAHASALAVSLHGVEPWGGLLGSLLNQYLTNAGSGHSPACASVQAVELQGKGPWWTAPSAVSALRITLHAQCCAYMRNTQMR